MDIRLLKAHCALIVALMLILMTASVFGAPVKINLWHIEPPTTPASAVIDEIVAEFNAGRSDIEIEVTYVQFTETGDFAEKVAVAIAGGSGPDVVEISGNWLASIGGALPLDAMLERSSRLHLDDFFPSQLQRAMLDGQLYGIPNHTDSRLLFYNVDLFNEAGLPGAPETWDDAYEYSRRLIRMSGQDVLTQAGLVPHWGQGWFYLWAATKGIRQLVDYDWWLPPSEQASEAKSLFNTTAAEETLQFMSDMVDLHGGLGAVQALGTTFGSGRTAMLVEGSWNVPNWRKNVPDLNWDVAPVPIPEGGERATLAGGFSWQIPIQTKHPNEAFEVIEHLVSMENNIRFATAGSFIPVHRDVVSSYEYVQDPVMGAFVAELAYAVPFPSVPFSSAMWDALNIEARDAVLRKEMSPKNALEIAAQKVDAAIKNTLSQ